MFYYVEGGAVLMTREEAYWLAMKMSEEERAAFKTFLAALLESEDTAQPPASVQQESS